MAGYGRDPGAGVPGWTTRRVAATRRCGRLSTFYFTKWFLLHPDRPSRVAPARWCRCPRASPCEGYQRSIDCFQLRTPETVRALLARDGCTVGLSLFAVVIVIDLEN